MFRLIQADFAATGERHLRDGAPTRFLQRRKFDALLGERVYLSFQIVTHEIKLLGRALIRWMNGGFSRREREDQPAMTGINGFETENITEKCAVRLGIFAVKNYVSAKNHLSS